jgi:hypothetical protein
MVEQSGRRELPSLERRASNEKPGQYLSKRNARVQQKTGRRWLTDGAHRQPGKERRRQCPARPRKLLGEMIKTFDWLLAKLRPVMNAVRTTMRQVNRLPAAP